MSPNSFWITQDDNEIVSIFKDRLVSLEVHCFRYPYLNFLYRDYRHNEGFCWTKPILMSVNNSPPWIKKLTLEYNRRRMNSEWISETNLRTGYFCLIEFSPLRNATVRRLWYVLTSEIVRILLNAHWRRRCSGLRFLFQISQMVRKLNSLVLFQPLNRTAASELFSSKFSFSFYQHRHHQKLTYALAFLLLWMLHRKR